MHWIEEFSSLAKQLGCEFVEVMHERGVKVVVGPCEDGVHTRDELIRKEIPVELILLVKRLFPHTPVFVRGLITKEEHDKVLAYIQDWRWHHEQD